MEGALYRALVCPMHSICLRFLLKAALLAGAVFTTSQALATDCVPFAEARHHLGKTQCVTGTVMHVKEGSNGVTFLDFCENYETCPFTVVVFQGDLKRVGDVRQLTGRAVEIKGTVEEYDGRAEIILRHPQQLGDSASLLAPLPKDAALAPTLPKDYDVERQGHYSAGSPKRPKKAKATATKKQGAPVSIDDPSQP
jgi:DNA/RNA endonuclease YhcR with UshA esterase domain